MLLMAARHSFPGQKVVTLSLAQPRITNVVIFEILFTTMNCSCHIDLATDYGLFGQLIHP